MKIKGIVWLGTRTSNFDAMVNLFQRIMGYVIYELTYDPTRSSQ